MAEAAKFVYMLQVVFKGQSFVVRKDLSELVEFMQEIEKLYNGYTDSYISNLLGENSAVDLDEEYDRAIK